MLAELDRALDGGPREPLARAAHRLKGSCASLGATHMASLCGQLELATGGSEPDDLRQLVDQVKAEFERVKAALERECLKLAS